MTSPPFNSDSEDDTRRRARLVEWFEAAVTRGSVGVDELRRQLQATGIELTHDGREDVALTWPGKPTPCDTKTPPPDARIEPPLSDAPGHDQLIVGDNLPIMRLLAQSMPAAVDLAYIDPPYNTGRDFTFEDRFPLANPAQPPKGGRRARSRSGWLNFLYPRIVALRALMSARGIFVAHIDEHELESLVLICKEIFGDASYLGSIVWDKGNPKGDARRIAYQHEHIVVFAKDPKQCPPLRRPKQNAQRILAAADKAIAASSDLDEARAKFAAWFKQARGLSGGEAMYKRIADDGRVYRLVSMAWPNKKTAPAEYFRPLIHPTTGDECPIPTRGWRNPPGTMDELLARDLIEFGPDHTTQPQRRYFLDEHMHEKIPSVLRFAGADDHRLRALGIPFEHPKPVGLAAQIVRWFAPPDALVCDCFAGSGTTGQAVWEANAQDGGARRFLLIQAPEPVADGVTQIGDGAKFERVDEITCARLTRVAAEAQGEGDSESPEFVVRRLTTA